MYARHTHTHTHMQILIFYLVFILLFIIFFTWRYCASNLLLLALYYINISLTHEFM